ncbi:site-specific DNA-methyltransferase [Maribacter algarum]|uniref:site-specific DNA-methyltransferase (adenine-specific) n=1 Tax=Maribacter algarum (ex Zhang et al. 2020) TaxID=2578118 RepID=A0A5S3PW57_9FLAO|nr:site-specific DNA-methyltransferase [Maribacter algarum]TMM58442.1 site-specific DNA-methyltransferase [Maribacter algarum]
MPTLNWIGKEKVINHHQDVPFRILEPQYTFKNGKEETPTNSKNKIIHGDNLEALKSLLPEHEGKIDCIYIDPPYNTGEENWIYNDNVSNPKIKKWLGQVVGKESEDLSRHDKWLCMMYPRLKLLNKLLSKKGVIFVSIDDNELYYLKILMDEIFGKKAFVTNFIWEKRTNRENRKVISSRHDYILCYCKNTLNFGESIRQLPMTEEALSRYKNPDDDKNGPWKSDPATAQAGHATESQFYELIAPNGKKHLPPSGRCWLFTKEVMQEKIKANEIWFGIHGNNVPRVKTYLNSKERGLTPETIIFAENASTNEGAKKEIKYFFEGEATFVTPKPSKLIQHLLSIATTKDSFVLDSFAGSGTTAHAVLSLNKVDGGDRKFIMVEMEDYANTITAERVKKAIKGYGVGTKSVEGTGGDFNFYELGQPMFLENKVLNESVGVVKIKEYVWYTETATPYIAQNEAYLLGTKNQTAYYFYYEKYQLTTLNEHFLRTLNTNAEQYIIYADLCLLDKTLMDKYHIVFKKIPRDITRF